MKRRNFLNLSAVAAAYLLLPSQAKASEDTYTGPLWIFVHASGGWDPTSLCDPKGSDIMAPNGTPMNKTFASDAIISTTAVPAIKYAPLVGNNYAFSTFFERFASKLLVLNGIDAQTNGHSTGTRYTFSGNLSKETTSVAAIFSAAILPSSPLSFLTFGGYDFTGGIIPATRLNTGAINRLAQPNLSGTTPYHSLSTEEIIVDYNKVRSDAMANSQPLASVRNSLTRFNQSHEQKQSIKDFQVLLEEADLNARPNTSMGRSARLAIASYKAGLTVSTTLRSGGFDTHSNHDANHVRRLGDLLRGVEEIVDEAIAQGVGSQVNIIIGSEFGRTRGYNGGNGKDHWPVTSMLFMGPSFDGGRVVGASTDIHNPLPVDPSTMQTQEEGGVFITAAHINKALRKLAGINNDPLVTQTFPINVEELNIFKA